MVEYCLKYPNRSKSKKKKKVVWREIIRFPKKSLVFFNFKGLLFRINGKLYTKRTAEFDAAFEKERIWSKLKQ